MVKQISDNEIYLLIKYIKSVLWRAAKRLSYIQEARCLKVIPEVCQATFEALKEVKYTGKQLCTFTQQIASHIKSMGWNTPTKIYN